MIHDYLYKDIISLKNLCEAWKEFVKHKNKKTDVCEFSANLQSNIFNLYADLQNRKYTHGSYEKFIINDPKTRIINKAKVRDRLLHHAIHRVLYKEFDKIFIYDSYSCRLGKGTHRAVKRYSYFIRVASKNFTQQCWVLKCDIRRFFSSIDHKILLKILKKYLKDDDTFWLLERVINSFHEGNKFVGLPLGNLTSQLLVNIYMDSFDRFVKEGLRQKYYIRYADDFVVINTDRGALDEILYKISDFLESELKLKLHPDKVFIKTIYSGLDFLGWVVFPNHKVLRTVTKRRMFLKIREKERKVETVVSYLGMLKHGNGYKLRKIINSNLES